ncbi:MAG: hypothetical protein ACLRZG_04980 [Streptococcus sp.]
MLKLILMLDSDVEVDSETANGLLKLDCRSLKLIGLLMLMQMQKLIALADADCGMLK